MSEGNIGDMIVLTLDSNIYIHNHEDYIWLPHFNSGHYYH